MEGRLLRLIRGSEKIRARGSGIGCARSRIRGPGRGGDVGLEVSRWEGIVAGKDGHHLDF